MTQSIVGFVVLFALLLLRVPLGFAMLLVGAGGFAVLVGVGPALAMAGQQAYDTGFSYTLSIIPLFVLMGNLVTQAGISRELYDAANAFLGHRRGGLAMASVVACGAFSAVCGSSLATAATMSKVAMPSMRRFGYDDSLATGAIAAGGTLGILIPPSVIMVIYGLLTEAEIGKLFIAGILPGLLGVLLYTAAVAATTALRPDWGPAAERTPWPGRLRALRGAFGIVVLFVVVIGGIYGGVFTPTEAAGVGAFAAFLMALLRRKLTFQSLLDVLVESAATTAMLFVVIIGALVFANFVTFAGLPDELAWAVQDLGASPWLVILGILAVFLILGCVLESLSMILLTVPVFYPIVLGLDLGLAPDETLVWFCIVVVVATEISLITPPIGMNVFVLRTVLPDVPLTTIFKGVLPFVASDVVRLALILLLPGLSLWLPSLMR